MNRFTQEDINGQWVRIKTWAEMEWKFGLDSGHINVTKNFTKTMEAEMPPNRIIKLNLFGRVPYANPEGLSRASYIIHPDMVAEVLISASPRPIVPPEWANACKPKWQPEPGDVVWCWCGSQEPEDPDLQIFSHIDDNDNIQTLNVPWGLTWYNYCKPAIPNKTKLVPWTQGQYAGHPQLKRKTDGSLRCFDYLVDNAENTVGRSYGYRALASQYTLPDGAPLYTTQIEEQGNA